MTVEFGKTLGIISDPQSDPQNKVCCATSVVLGVPLKSVSRCKTYGGWTVTAAVWLWYSAERFENTRPRHFLYLEDRTPKVTTCRQVFTNAPQTPALGFDYLLSAYLVVSARHKL